MELIDKATIVEELERLYNLEYSNTSDLSCGKKIMLRHIRCFLNILKVKKINLEKELDMWRHNHFCGRRDKNASGEYLERVSQLNLAKHFYELGLKTQKRE